MINASIQTLLHEAEGLLSNTSNNARLEAEVLLAHALEKPRSYLRAWPAREISDAPLAQFQLLLTKRAAGEPIAYLTGCREFWSMELRVNQHTLIPRPETELLVEFALQLIPQNEMWRIADLGTGSGAIALALACERPQCRIIATDISPDALMAAKYNAKRHKANNIAFREGAWFAPLRDEQFDLIVANPPYIRECDPHLDQGDLRYEPVTALVSGISGLDALQTIISEAPGYLRHEGWLVLEHGYDQADAVIALLRDRGYTGVGGQKDYAGRGRIAFGQTPTPR